MSELEDEMGRIFRAARRVGTARGRKSGKKLGVFSARRGGRRYRIVARPLFGNRHAVVDMSPAPMVEPASAAVNPPEPAVDEPLPADSPPEALPPETSSADAQTDGGSGDESSELQGEEVLRYWFTNPALKIPTAANPAIQIAWNGPFELTDPKLKTFANPVVYILEDKSPANKGVPIYVGTAEKAAKRMGEHLAHFKTKTRLFDPKRLKSIGIVPTALQVRIGTVTLRPIRVFETLEHAIVRTIQPDPKKKQVLLNERPLARFKAVDRIVVNGIVPSAPKYPSKTNIDLAAGSHYEIQG